LRGVNFEYLPEYNSPGLRLGFIAQEIELIVPEIVTQDVAGIRSVDYSKLTALLAEAIQDLNLKLEDLATTSATSTDPSSFTSRFFASLFARLAHWFADTANGIASIISDTLTARERLCVGDTCVTEDQLKSLLGQSAAAGASAGGGPSAPGGSSTDNGDEVVDTATTTTPASDDEAAGAPGLVPGVGAPASSAVEENANVANPTTPSATDPSATAGNDNQVEPAPLDEPEAANDNDQAEPVPATGTK
jgi:hypothetical protein